MERVSKKSDRLCFSDDVKSRWHVSRDECGDEYICLTGNKALGKGGLDHIYPFSLNRVGLWITSGAINGTINRLQSKISGLQVEQLGDSEVVLSAPVEKLANA